MARKRAKLRDPYGPAIAALSGLNPGPGLTTIEAASRIATALEGWDHDRLGDWRDALAVAARRRELHVRNSFALLARFLMTIDHQRAAEIGKLLEKFAVTRAGASLPGAVKRAGGLKAATAAGFVPAAPMRPRIRRAGAKET